MARDLDVRTGSVTDPIDMDALLEGVGFVAVMLGDRSAQRRDRINTDLIVRLVPAMRRQGVRRLLYQAGGLSRPPDTNLSPVLWVLRHTLARSYNGQHEDNEAVMAYLAAKARDLDWVVHRAGIALQRRHLPRLRHLQLHDPAGRLRPAQLQLQPLRWRHRANLEV